MPFGLATLNWVSATLAGHLTYILLQEALGINTVITGDHLSSAGALFAVSGCTMPDASGGIAARGCGNTFSRTHAVMEAWASSAGPAFIEALSEVIGEAALPIDLGSMGYDGTEGLFVPTNPRLAALENAGLALEYYRSFNASWHSPNIFFQNYTAIDTTDLLKCRDTKFAASEQLKVYVALTNDTDGVETVNGALIAKCHGGPDGHWWFAPSCRSHPETCIPVIDSGDGWFVDVFMQRAGAFNMPLALSVGTWGKYTSEPKVTNMLVYWWSPDDTFIDMRPTSVEFPKYNKMEWADGIKTSDSATTACKKWTHFAIPDVASRAAEVIKNIQLSLSELELMLFDLKRDSSKTAADIACEWLKANENTWRPWVPSDTKCPNGWGLISSAGAFAANRSAATSCEWCPPGRYSQKLQDSMGQTAICVPCETGQFQPSPGQSSCVSCSPGAFAGRGGMSECRECAAGTAVGEIGSSECPACRPGTFAGDVGFSECTNCAAGRVAPAGGAQACDACPIGTYAAREGLTNCTECGGGDPMWTTMRKLPVKGTVQWVRTDAADSEDSCGCDTGARFDDAGVCVECTQGMWCPGMGEVLIVPGFYSPPELSVFRCGDALKCKGGIPGDTCSDGREGIRCAACKVDLTPGRGGVCVPCNGIDRAPFAILVTFCILACLAAYWGIDRGGSSQPSHTVLLVGVSVGLLVALAQQLSVVGKLDVEYMDPLSTFMQVIKFFTFDVESFIRISCVGTLLPAARFVMKICLIFATCVVVLICHICFVIMKHKCQFRERNATLVAVLGTIAMVFYISVTVTILQPLQCEQSPNGRWTTHVYQDVICWEPDVDGQHPVMLGVGCAALSFPLLLFAKVFQVTRKLPAALKSGDTDFMRSYGFLFFRFRPHAHWYIIVIMARSLLVGLVPIIPLDVAQVYALQIVLLISFGACVYFQPWRIAYLNGVDAVFSGGLILFLNITSLLVKSTDLEIVGWVSVSIVFGSIALLVTVVFVALLRRCGKLAKPYRFFLCHCKADAGAFARWLKLELLSNPEVRQDVFLDADNLESLDCLLGYVAADVHTFILIASRTIFLRPWCVGEMTTAHVNGVHSTTLRLPDFDPLTHTMVENFEAMVPDLEGLCVDNGLTLQIVRVALSFFNLTEAIDVPSDLAGPGMSKLGKLMIAGKHSGSLSLVPPPPKGTSRVCIVRDRTVEANAIAFCLQRLMVRYTCFAETGSPEVLCIQDDEKIPSHIQKSLLLCTQGCFAQVSYLNRILEMSDRGIHILPVIGDDEFNVPRPHSFSAMKTSKLAHYAHGGERSADSLASVVSRIFKEIAVPFKAKYDRMSALDAAAMRASQRLTDPPYKRDVRPVSMTLVDSTCDSRHTDDSGAVTRPENDTSAVTHQPSMHESREVSFSGMTPDDMDMLESENSSGRCYTDKLNEWMQEDFQRLRV